MPSIASTRAPNRFAAVMPREAVAVVLDPDVAVVFPTAEAVNHALRSLMAAFPEQFREAAADYRAKDRPRQRG